MLDQLRPPSRSRPRDRADSSHYREGRPGREAHAGRGEDSGVHRKHGRLFHLRSAADMSPRLTGMIDALNGNATPASQRPAIPFDGLDRLEFWQGRRQAEEEALISARARVCPPVRTSSRSTKGRIG